MTNDLMRMGALVSASVATGKAPLLFAMRSEPVDEADSGWQFTEGDVGRFGSDQPNLWLVSEVIDLEPSVSEFIELPYGTTITRRSLNARWIITV
jgi:hypothetical protein